MMRIANVIAFFVTATLAVILYSYKYETRELDRRVLRLMDSIDHERQTISVLKAEWSHLNRPDRIQHLSREYLNLGPMQPIQYVPAEKMTGVLNQLPAVAEKSKENAQDIDRAVMDELVDHIVERESSREAGD